MKNKILITLVTISMLLLVICIGAIDADSWLPFAGCAASMGFLFAFMVANGLITKFPRW